MTQTLRQCAIAILLLLFLVGCAEHIEEPWVSKDDYLADNLNRSAELNEALDQRVQHQNDR
ncbi:MAG: hypothetical protein PVF34_05520 [Gammaproteobacteria bacterium]